MKDRIFGVLQKIGRSFMLPIAVLPIAGLFLGIGGSFTNETMLKSFGLLSAIGPGTAAGNFFSVLNAAGSAVFNNLPLLFAVAVAIGMSDRDKATAALSAVLGFLIMNAVIMAFITFTHTYDTATLAAANEAAYAKAWAAGTKYVPIKESDVRMLPPGALTSLLGYNTLATGVFGGILVGCLAAWATNKFYNCQLPPVISFFSGSRAVPIVTAVVCLVAGIITFYVWPYIQVGMNMLGQIVIASGYIGSFAYGYIERALIPFGLHHVFYLPFWQTAVGGQMEVGGKMIYGAQNIFFAQLSDPTVDHFSVNATRFMAGKYPFMIFGLPGAALAMYQTAYTEKKQIAGGLLLSAALTAMITGITEPIEFTFIFVAPALYYGVHCVLAGLSFMLMHMLNAGVGMTFSGGLIDLVLFGVMQGNAKTNWVWIIIVGAAYFFIYWLLFKWLIIKWDLPTTGREKEGAETKMYTKADYQAKKGEGGAAAAGGGKIDMRSAAILKGIGGKDNLTAEPDNCITRLRLSIKDPSLVDEDLLKETGAVGVIAKGTGLQVIYGPTVPGIKNALVDFLETPESDHVDELFAENGAKVLTETAPAKAEEKPADKKEAQTDNVVVEAVEPAHVVKVAEEIAETGVSEEKEVFTAPIAGRCASITESPDDVFSQKMLGDGIVIFPTGSQVFAPCDGTIATVFPTGHAVGMQSADGTELLIHAGVDTVNLEGKGFTPHVKDGDTVKQGDLLIDLDLAYIEANAPSSATMLIFTALPAEDKVELLKTGDVTPKDAVVAVVPQD